MAGETESKQQWDLNLKSRPTPRLRASSPPSKGGASNNGVLYSSEYYYLLLLNGELTEDDRTAYDDLIHTCFKEPGLLMRNPDGNGGQEGPDDYYGLALGAAKLSPSLAADVLKYGIKHWGSFNNETPGKWTGASFLWRQIQLYSCFKWAAGQTPNPLFRLYTAIVIALGGFRKPTTDSDARILSWIVIQIASPKSWMCRVAEKIWRRRLLKDYPNGMKDVVSAYFGSEHPLAKYWHRT
jgi:hypothetical protein